MLKQTILPFMNISCISLGPGDTELLTLKALKALNKADVIFCPATQSGEKIVSRAKDILDEIGIAESKVHIFSVPMNKNRAEAKKVYIAISEKITEQYRKKKSVAFVAEGDAGFYSSVHYISDILSMKGIPVQHIAGVPAFIACGALAGIHVAKQNEPLLILPANASAEEIEAEVNAGKSVVLMKLSQQEEAIKNSVKMLSDAQFHYFENTGVPLKEFYTCNPEEIIMQEFPYFSIIIIKKLTK